MPLLGLALLLAAAALFLAWPRLELMLDPDAPPVSEARLKQAVEAEALARERAARAADNGRFRSESELLGSSWAWGAGQLIAAAPAESRDLHDRYFDYLRSVENDDCDCYYSDSSRTRSAMRG